MSATDRVIVLVDMDCFYCQVEQKLDPSLVGKPLAVVQYNAWKGGGLIAVSYEARAKGVTRHMRGDEAKAKCPDIELARVPTVRGKADLTRYREAGKQVAEVLQSFTTLLERASVDEAYLDITDSVNQRLDMALKGEQLRNTHIVGFDNVEEFLRELDYDRSLNDSNVKLVIGGVITEEIRAVVYEKTGYRCSAGVAHNKILAKLTAGLHKPNQQTVLPHESVSQLYENLSVKKIRSMGGKFGDEVMQKLNVNVMADLLKFSEKELQQYFDGKTANWLYNIARGINNDPVTVRLVSKSIGCCKRFPGRTALVTEKTVRHWTSELSIEISERIQKDIEENNRKPKQLVISYTQRVGTRNVSNTRSNSLNTTEQEKIYQEAYEIIRKNCQRDDGGFCITFLGLNVGKFEEIKNIAPITTFFKNAQKRLSNGPTNDTSSKSNDMKNNSCSDEIQELSREIHKVVQENIELNKSFGDNNVVFKKGLSDNKKQELTIPTAYIDKRNGNSNNLEIEDGADNSETELEAINSSINEADTSIVSLTGKNSFFRNFLNPAKIPKRDFNTSSILHELTNDEINDSDMKAASVVDNVNNESHNLIEENILEDRKSPVIGSKSIDESQSKTSRILRMFNNTNNNNGKNVQDAPTTSRQSYITDDNKELCLECNKLIPVEKIVSHMDHHFAIKMVREEAHLYKQDKTVRNEGVASETNVQLEKSKSIAKLKDNSSSNKTKSPKVNKTNNNTFLHSRKRKHSQATEITNFLNRCKNNGADDMTDDNSEFCPDCCKRIKLNDIASHSDYHVAKKLHQRINSDRSSTVNARANRSPQKCDARVINKNCDKTIRVKKNAGFGNIASYFKKV